MPYMVAFTINIPQMLAYIPYMDPMGNGSKSQVLLTWGFPARHGALKNAGFACARLPRASMSKPRSVQSGQNQEPRGLRGVRFRFFSVFDREFGREYYYSYSRLIYRASFSDIVRFSIVTSTMVCQRNIGMTNGTSYGIEWWFKTSWKFIDGLSLQRA